MIAVLLDTIRGFAEFALPMAIWGALSVWVWHGRSPAENLLAFFLGALLQPLGLGIAVIVYILRVVVKHPDAVVETREDSL